MRLKILICLLLAGITVAVYWPARHYEIVLFDDPMFVTKNPEINSGLNWNSLWWAFSRTLVANWHPVTSLSFVLDHQLWGVNPGAEHLVNLLFHAVNASLLFLVLHRLTGATWRSAIAAAIFAWHPLRVESVAWIAERKDVLCGFFFLLTLLTYARFAQKSETGSQKQEVKNLVVRFWTPVSGSYWLALLFFALALMSKPMAVTLPFILLLLDVWPLQRAAGNKWRAQSGKDSVAQTATLKHLLFEKWPFFALAFFISWLTYWIQKNSPAMASLNQLGLSIRFDNAIMSYLRYLIKSLWPTGLAVQYPLPLGVHSDFALWPQWEIWTTFALLLAVSVFCLRLITQKPYLAVGWFWYLITMLPVIGLVQVGGQGMADRYTYIPLIGPVIALVWLIADFFRAGKIILPAVTTIVLAASIILTRHQLLFWKNTVSLFEHTVDVTGENAFAHFVLATGLEHDGQVGLAMVHYRIATKSNPTVKEAFWNLGLLLTQHEKWVEAEKTYSALLDIMPDETSHLQLAAILPHLGRKDEAVQHLEAALRINPNSLEALNNLAWILATSTNTDFRDGGRAVQLAEHACELTYYQKAVFIGTLAAAYAEAGRFDDAIATAQKACALAAKNGETSLLQKNQELLELYRTHKPYRE